MLVAAQTWNAWRASTWLAAAVAGVLGLAGPNPKPGVNSLPVYNTPETRQSEWVCISLNDADWLQLTLLPGVGGKTAQRIVCTRQALGGYRTVQDLLLVPGIGPATLAKLEPHVDVCLTATHCARPEWQVRRTADTLVDLNTATRAQLEGHCWLTKPTLGKLLQAQRRKLGLRGWDDVRRISGIRPRELAWLQANCVIRPRIPTALDLNTATEAELQRLPGVGPALARRIVAHRDSVGGFCSLAHLDDVRGIGPATLAKWQGLAIVVPRADTTHTRSEGP